MTTTTAHASLPQPGGPSIREAPVVGGGALGGALRAFRSDPLGMLTRAVARHGDLVQLRFGPFFRVYVLTHPDHVQHVLVDGAKNYSKRTRGYDALRLLLGNGLVTSEGEFWRRQRRIAQPAFHKKRIAAFAHTMASEAMKVAQRWCGLEGRAATVDVAHEMTDLTLRIVSQTLLSVQVDDADRSIGNSVDRMNAFARDMMTNPLSLPMWVPTRKNREFRRHAGALDGIVTSIIEQRRRTGEDTGDLLSMLMAATDADTGERMTDAQLRDEVMTIFLAGHETTANALAWTLLLLSEHPDVARRLRAELDSVLGGRVPTLEDLAHLPYTRAVVQESMRLYPPAWSMGRRAEFDDVVDGYRIRAQSLVILSPWVTHRSPAWWPNPEGFDPERFAPDAPKRPRYAYFPFGGGPRQCIGNNFALMETELVLATLMSHVSVALVPGRRPEPLPFITLQPKGGIAMHVSPRTPDIAR